MPRKLASLLADGPAVMGIVNVTPDSFSDGGEADSIEKVVSRARAMVADGARIIDVGGESTRPGADPVDADTERARVVPAIRALRAVLPETWLSVDTMKAPVMRAAAEAGADIVNDVYGLRGEGALAAVRDSGLAACLMHMQGEPRTMQAAPRYDDVVAEVRDWLRERIEVCIAAGIPAESILVDPGIGFGKSLAHNLALLAHVSALRGLGAGVLIGASRKSMFGKLLGLPVDQRLAPGLAVAAIAVFQGAAIIRTHDVRDTAQAVATAAALRATGAQGET